MRNKNCINNRQPGTAAETLLSETDENPTMKKKSSLEKG
jgi:hypothetical protein